MVGKIILHPPPLPHTPPKKRRDFHILISRTCEYITLHGKGTLQVGQSYRLKNRENILDYPGGFSVIALALQVGRRVSERVVTMERRPRESGTMRRIGPVLSALKEPWTNNALRQLLGAGITPQLTVSKEIETSVHNRKEPKAASNLNEQKTDSPLEPAERNRLSNTLTLA